MHESSRALEVGEDRPKFVGSKPGEFMLVEDLDLGRNTLGRDGQSSERGAHNVDRITRIDQNGSNINEREASRRGCSDHRVDVRIDLGPGIDGEHDASRRPVIRDERK